MYRQTSIFDRQATIFDAQKDIMDGQTRILQTQASLTRATVSPKFSFKADDNLWTSP
jgi:hypothetical protein